VDGELEYQVEAIISHKQSKVGRGTKTFFLVQWKGYGREHDTWEPADVVDDCEALDVYLHRLQADNDELPPGYSPGR
jgi:hypothetical protein